VINHLLQQNSVRLNVSSVEQAQDWRNLGLLAILVDIKDLHVDAAGAGEIGAHQSGGYSVGHGRKAKTKNRNIVDRCFRYPATLGGRKQSIVAINEWLACEARRQQTSGIPIGSAIEAPSP
jgi:hypothetical protein